jgi:hypothetical protein
MSLPLQIAGKKFQKILDSVRTMDQRGAILPAENDWQPARLPYNV